MTASASAACCAIDFGTSNSAVAWVDPATATVRLVALEDGHATMPTANYYNWEFNDTGPDKFSKLSSYKDGLAGCPASEGHVFN